nr:hypothetical protein [Sicyoidochytrium minutum DNA virus]
MVNVVEGVPSLRMASWGTIVAAI